jgi:hypothetical protein
MAAVSSVAIAVAVTSDGVDAGSPKPDGIADVGGSGGGGGGGGY